MDVVTRIRSVSSNIFHIMYQYALKTIYFQYMYSLPTTLNFIKKYEVNTLTLRRHDVCVVEAYHYRSENREMLISHPKHPCHRAQKYYNMLSHSRAALFHLHLRAAFRLINYIIIKCNLIA